ncbi:MAG: hypothetical protein WBD16_10645 [Pyrinomonadaceae bacterium]
MKCLFLISLILSTGFTAYAQNCGSVPSGVSGEDGFRRWCHGKGGSIVDAGYGKIGCFCKPTTPSTAAGTSTANPYEGLFGWLFSIDADAKIRAQRKAALIRQLEYDRQDAIRRQQTAQAQKLNGILQRLMSGDMALKGVGGENDLQLKLGSEPILFGEFMSTPATSTTGAMLTLKTGDDASPSPQSQPVRSAEAATTTATTNSANIAAQPQLSPEMKAIAEELSKLSPEQQQRLLEAIKSTETQTAANATVATTSPEKVADTQLSLKLTDAKTVADNLNAAANTAGSPEQVKEQADAQFDQLQKVTATQTQTTANSPRAVVITAGAPQPPATGPQTSNAKDPCDAAPNIDSKTVDLRCAKQPLRIDPGLPTPTSITSGATSAQIKPAGRASVPSSIVDDVKKPKNELSFLAQMFPGKTEQKRQTLNDLTTDVLRSRRWPGPSNPGEPLRNPLVDAELKRLSDEYSVRYADKMTDAALTRPLTQIERDFAVLFFTGYGDESAEVLYRYNHDREFRASIDKAIDNSINEAVKKMTSADVAFIERVIPEMREIEKNYSTPGQEPDFGKLNQNAAFVEKRREWTKKIYAAWDANRYDAKIHLWVLLADRFLELKNNT